MSDWPATGALEHRVAHEMRRLVPPGTRCVVAVSGGPDSIALLDLLHRGAGHHTRSLFVGHVDHGIHPDSGIAADVSRKAASERGLPFHLAALQLGPGCSETVARRARRTALRAIAAETGSGAIILAHHADDQAETVLLRLLRGSGPAGLAGMAPRHGLWVRPLLAVRRTELQAHVAARGLIVWTDPANTDPRHLRSWLRSAVLPTIAARLPDVVERLTQAGSQAATARAGWRQVLDLLPGLDFAPAYRGISVAAPVLHGYRSPLRHAVLAVLGRQVGALVGARRLAALDRLLGSSAGRGRVTLSARVQAELAFGRLTFHEIEAVTAEAVRLAPGEPVTLAGSRFDVRVEPAGPATRGGWSAMLSPGSYAVRRWRPGDRIRPLGGAGSRPVAVLLREARVAPARRTAWPVVVDDEHATIVWVPGICRADAGVPAEGTEAWRVECAIA